MRTTTFGDGTMIFTAWCKESSGLIFETQVRARDRQDAARRIKLRRPRVVRVMADPDIADPDLDPVT